MTDTEKLEWEVSCERFVAYFDIMGFKELLLRNNNEYISTLFDNVMQYCNLHDSGIFFMDELNINVKLVRHVIFSDTFLFYSLDNSNESLKAIIAISNYFLTNCHGESIPIKGFLSAGEFHANKNKSKYFGLPLSDSYLKSENLFFYGAALDHNIENYVNKYSKECSFSSAFYRFNCIPYNCVFKGVGKVEHLVLTWPIGLFFGSKSPEDIIDNFKSTVSGKTRKYVENTKDFVHKVYPFFEELGVKVINIE